MKTYLKNIHWLFFIVFMVMLASCKTEKVTIPPESHKDITGTWKIITAIRNGTTLFAIPNTQNLPAGYDFSQFRVVFTAGGYTINNQAPFIVSDNGTWALDQPSYSQLLTFTPVGSTAITADFDYPVTAGKRQIILSFKPGCNKNSYQYVLEKTNDQ